MNLPIYELSSIIFEGAENYFGEEHPKIEELDAKYKAICEKLDEALKDSDMSEIKIKVDEETMEIHLEVVLPGIWR